MSPIKRRQNLNDALTGGKGKAHEAGVIDGHDLIAHIEFARAGGRAVVQHAGQDDSGEDGAPARFHDHHAQNLSLLLFKLKLRT